MKKSKKQIRREIFQLAFTSYADAFRLRQVLINLVGNAIKFAGQDANKVAM